MKDELWIIGFDTREMYMSYDQTWSETEKEHFLLRKYINKPLSTFRKVWSSIFIDRVSSEMMGLLNVFGLWVSLAEMRDYYSNIINPIPKNVWEIAISKQDVEGNQTLRTQSSWSLGDSFIPQCEPSHIDPRWLLLGYDVSDDSLWSMLYADHGTEEFPNIRQLWSRHLNQHHLFSEINYAIDFAKFANQVDSGHAPFSVYGLYLIQDKQ